MSIEVRVPSWFTKRRKDYFILQSEELLCVYMKSMYAMVCGRFQTLERGWS